MVTIFFLHKCHLRSSFEKHFIGYQMNLTPKGRAAFSGRISRSNAFPDFVCPSSFTVGQRGYRAALQEATGKPNEKVIRIML